MPKKTPNNHAPDFGRRLTALMVKALNARRGAGAYLAKKYKVSTVTANAWLKGTHRPEPTLARRIAEDHDASFNELYFGKNSESLIREDQSSYGEHVDLAGEVRQLTLTLIALFEWIQTTRPIEAPLLAAELAKVTDPMREFGETGTLDMILGALGPNAVDEGRAVQAATARKKPPSGRP